MRLNPEARILARALLEDESPKDFLKRHHRSQQYGIKLEYDSDVFWLRTLPCAENPKGYWTPNRNRVYALHFTGYEAAQSELRRYRDYSMSFREAKVAPLRTPRVLKAEESAKDFLKRHPGRSLVVKNDPSHPKYFQVPIPSGNYSGSGKYVNLFRPKSVNPVAEIKARLLYLIRSRKGFQVGDTFKTPWGNFQVTDTLGIKEV